MFEQVFLECEFVASFQVVDMQRLRDETHGSSEAVLDGTVLKWLKYNLQPTLHPYNGNFKLTLNKIKGEGRL